MSIPDSRICFTISRKRPVAYADALAWQYALQRHRQADEVNDAIIIVEHPPTITLGRGAEADDLLASDAELAEKGIAVIPVDRGGEITYHAPGQIVAYPILDLKRHGQDLHRYLRDLEEVIIRTLDAYDIAACRIPDLTGVWVDDAKIAAIGIKVSRWVSMHGFALNIDMDMTPMRTDFIPCGIRDRGVTSLREIMGDKTPTRAEVESRLMRDFADVFQVDIRPASSDLLTLLGIMGA